MVRDKRALSFLCWDYQIACVDCHVLHSPYHDARAALIL